MILSAESIGHSCFFVEMSICYRMAQVNLENFGTVIAEARGSRGIRVVSAEIGISTATLSRVENGQTPDLETFRRICTWLKINPGEVLGFGETNVSHSTVVHFRKKKTVSIETANALTGLIIAAAEYLDSELESRV